MAPKAPVSGTGKVFFDVDGTLLPTEMPHACLLFILGLPHFWQRLWKLLLFWLVLVPVIIINKLLGEAAAIRVLAFSTLQGVSVADAKTAGAYSSDRMLECARPAILAEIQRHKTLGHHVTLLSGNLNPLIEPLGAKLDCVVVCTQCTVSASHHYTGGVLKEPMVGAPKAEHVQKHGEKHERHGYGNSHNDIAFLKHVGAAHVVAPDSRLRNHAKKEGWSTSFATPEESDDYWALNTRFYNLLKLGSRAVRPKKRVQ